MKRYRELVICGIVGLGVLIAWFGWSVIETSKQALPSSVRDLRSFMDAMPTPDAVNRIEVGGAAYYEVVGPIASTFAAPSGPPVYIFAEDLSVVDWTIDNGEDPSFTSRWRSDSRRELGQSELQELLAPPRALP